MRQVLFLLILLGVAACGRQQFSAPRNLDNACLLAQERPEYMQAMQLAESNWGAPVPVQMATIYQESRLIGDARTPYRYALGVIPTGRVSSAFGYSQALDGTWDDYRAETGNRRANRTDIFDATDFIGWYMTHTVNRNGIPMGDARNQNLAYPEGPAGFARGSYNRKAWLLRVADTVADRAELYQAQLITCGG